MRSITTALLLLVTARSIPTEEYEIPAGKTIETVSTYEPTTSEESTPTHSERVGRLPACETELVFPCEVQKIFLEKFVDDSEGQLTLEDLEQMSKAIEEIYADQKEQDEIFNALDLLVDEKRDEIIAFGLNVLNGDVELADESLMYAVNGEAIWDEVEHEETEEPVVTEEIIIVTEDAEGLEMTGAPVEHEEKESYLAPKPQAKVSKATEVIPSITMHPTYVERSYTQPIYTRGPIPARTYKPYVPETPGYYAPTRATYAPIHATYAPRHATYAPIPLEYMQIPTNTVGAASKRHVAPTMTAKTAKRSTHTPSYAKSNKQLKATNTNNVWKPTGEEAHYQKNYFTGAPRTYTHKTHSPATIPATITKAYPGFHPTLSTASLAHAKAYVPTYTGAPMDYTYPTYPYATPLPYPAKPIYPEPLNKGAALPLDHTYPEERIAVTGTPMEYTRPTYPYATPLPYPAKPVYPEPLYEGAALPLDHTTRGYPEEPITGTGDYYQIRP